MWPPASGDLASALEPPEATKTKTGPHIQPRSQLATALDGFKEWQAITTSNPSPNLKDVEALARRWASEDGQKAVEFGIGITDPIQRGAFLAVALSRWFGHQPEAVLAWLRPRADRLQLVFRTTPLEYSDMLKQDVKALGHLTALFEGSPTPAPYANHALRVWHHADQREALTAWLHRQPPTFERDLAWRIIASEAALSEPRAAVSMAEEITDENMRRQVTSNAAACLARRSPADALDFASRLPEGKDRTAAWQSALGTWALDDPSAALGYVRKNASAITAGMIQPISRQWSLTQPREFLNLLRSMQEENESKLSMVREVVYDWRNQVPDEARQWLDSADASWIPADERKQLQRVFDQPMSLGGGGKTVQGRRFWSGG